MSRPLSIRRSFDNRPIAPRPPAPDLIPLPCDHAALKAWLTDRMALCPVSEWDFLQCAVLRIWPEFSRA